MKEIDYYTPDPRKWRELMDYATRLQDERLIEKKEGARHMIITLKANNADNSFILRVVKNAVKESLSDEETNELIKDIESN